MNEKADTLILREILDAQLRNERLLQQLVEQLAASQKPRKRPSPLTREDVRGIKKMLLDGVSQSSVAKATGRSSATVHAIAKELKKQREPKTR